MKSEILSGAAAAALCPAADLAAAVALCRAKIEANRVARLAFGPVLTPSERLLRAIFGVQA
jgi:hypothetical protein